MYQKTIISRLPTDLVQGLKYVRKTVAKYSSSFTNIEYKTRLFLPTYREITTISFTFGASGVSSVVFAQAAAIAPCFCI